MSSIRKNFIYNVIYQLLVLILPIITAPYISRVLGPVGLGTYSYTYSIANYFLLFAMLGVANFGNRSIAMVRNDPRKISETFWNIFTMQFISAICITIIYIFFCIYFYGENKLIGIIQTIFVLSAIFDVNWFFSGIEKFKLIVIRNFIIKILTVLLVFIFVKSTDDLWIYAMIMSLGTLISQSIIWIFLRRYLHFVKPNVATIKDNIKPYLILFLPVLAYSIYRIMDKIMIGSLSNLQQLGYYENADKILVIPMGIIVALGTVMLPRVSNLVSNGQRDLQKRYIEMSMKYVSIISCALMFGMAGISEVLAPVYFGEEFAPSGKLIMYLSPIILISSFANVIRTQYLIPEKKDNLYVISMIVAAILNFVLNYFLIPLYGANGAIIGSIVAESTILIIQIISVKKELPIKKYFLDNYIYFLFGFVMFITVKFTGELLKENISTLITQIIIGSVVYCSLVILYMIVTKDSFLKKMLIRKKDVF